MSKQLPVRPSLEHLKAQAKDLLVALERGDAAAFARVSRSLPAAHGAAEEKIRRLGLALHDAQSVVAREYGFSSWAELKAEVTSKTEGPSAAALRELMARHGAVLGPEVERAMVEAGARPVPKLALPTALPLVPLRNALLSVGAIAPIVVGRETSIAAVHAAEAGARLIAMFTQTHEANEAPGESDLHPVGCVAELCAVVPSEVNPASPVLAELEGAPLLGAGGHQLTIVVKAIAWVNLAEVVHSSPFITVRVEPFVVNERLAASDAPLVDELRERVRQILATMPGADTLLRITERMSALELADSTLANLKCSVDAKASYAREPSVGARLRRVLALLDAEAQSGTPPH
jgi:hypothetical protein